MGRREFMKLEMSVNKLSTEQNICNPKQHSTVVWQCRSILDYVAYRCVHRCLRNSGIYGTRDGTFFAEFNIQWTLLIIFFVKGLPRSGGEKNYLEYIYRRPKFMVTCTFAVYAVLFASHLIVTVC